MIRSSIKRQIIGIAVGLIVLMTIVSVLSMVMVSRGSTRLDQLTNSYIPVYGNLARVNVYTLERALALRNMVIDKQHFSADNERFAAHRRTFEERGEAVEREATTALERMQALIAQGSSFADNVALATLATRINGAINDQRRYLNNEITRLLPMLDNGSDDAIVDSLARIDALRGELNAKIDEIRSDMLALVTAGGDKTARSQTLAMIAVAVMTLLAALLGLTFAVLISTGMTRPVERLLAGTRAVEAGDLQSVVEVTSKDEIGHLTAAFNRMVEQLRLKERIRQTFGRYVDPRVVSALIERPDLTQADGERRVMTVLFCDMKGFASGSQQMTPQGLVRVMNRYLSTMSEPIHHRRGIIDKYIGDAIMAYWGPPFTDEADHAELACLAALDMASRVAILQKELPDLLGVRALPMTCDIRIGIATGEVVVGSIGSDHMMSYTVMGDTVNLASRLESLNKFYGSRVLATEATVTAATDLEVREIDRVTVAGQTSPERIFEIIGPKGEISPAQITLRTHYATGLAAYREKRWDDARASFLLALTAVPADGPSKALLERVDRMRLQPAEAHWDGVWRMEQK